MKRALIMTTIFMIIFALLPFNVTWAQLEAFGQAGAGMFIQDGEKQVAIFSGIDAEISHDTLKGLSIFNRAMILYSKFDDSFKGGADFLIIQKRLGLWRDLYIGFGPGYYYRVKGEGDEQNLAIRFLVGTDILGDVGIDFGADYIPSIPVEGKEDQATTRWLLYAGINLYPRL